MPTRPFARSALTTLVALALGTYARGAAAQQSGWSVDRFEPAPAGDLFLSAQSPSYLSARPVSARFALTGVYAYQPLLASVLFNGTRTPVVAIAHSAVLHLQANVHLAQRLGLDLDVPLYVAQIGSTDPALPVRQTDGVALGDPRLGARVRIAGHAERDAASLHVGAFGYLGFLGLSSRDTATSDGRVRARFFVAGAGRAGLFRWALTVGAHARPGITASYATIGNELYANAGVGFTFASERVTVGAEAAFSTAFEQAFQPGYVALEALAVAKANLLDGALQLGLGAGPGLTQAPGTPAFRGALSVTYTPTFGSARPPHATQEPAPGSAHAAPTPTPVTVDPEDTTPLPPMPSTPPPASFCEASSSGCSTGDRDGDGVLEPLDECPDEPAGELHDARRAGCPARDADHDGVADEDDACVDQPQGHVPDPERRGCPLPDRDGDRIADAVDHCPDQPGAPHPDPRVNGCPGLVQLDEGTLRILQPIFFPPNRAEVEARSIPVLEGVRQALLARPDILRMVVEGHTDDRGNDELNVDLSHRRAAAVVRWLTDHGIAPSRLQPQGYGPSRPRTPVTRGMSRAQSNEARAANRRVQFELVTP